ncbi:hypothetical protein Btru_076559 [Bulinus truncatus]|nr:hypothetical protein Btru_076559 [Bulinus truncatus]
MNTFYLSLVIGLGLITMSRQFSEYDWGSVDTNSEAYKRLIYYLHGRFEPDDSVHDFKKLIFTYTKFYTVSVEYMLCGRTIVAECKKGEKVNVVNRAAVTVYSTSDANYEHNIFSGFLIEPTI